MRLFMTDGMFGRCLEQIGPEFNTFQEAMVELSKWKSSELNKKFYKIERYDRVICDKKRGETAIDFGDYSTFMLVTHGGKREEKRDDTD